MNLGKYNHITDQELLDRFYEQHQNEWLGILLQRYTLLLFGVCMKYLKNEEEAKDAVQQVFMKALTELQKYKVAYFKSWIYMVARNYCLMKLRNKTGKAPVSLDKLEIAGPDESQSRKGYLDKDHALDLMDSSLQELNRDQKLCVTLFYLEKKSYQDIMNTTGFTMMQVKSHIQNGKRNLKILFDKKMNGRL